MKANTITFSLAAVLCLLVACSAWGKVIYVDDDAGTTGDGVSWTTAYRFLQDALAGAAAADEAVEIRVAQGNYTPDRSAAKPQGGTGAGARYFLLTDGVSLLGGYAGLAGEDPNARDIRSYQTVLSGDLLGNDAPVTDASMLTNEPTRDDNSEVIMLDCGEVRLEGCTITGGGYGGLHVTGMPSSPDSTVRISDCTLNGNRYPLSEWVAAGAASVSAFVDVVFVRCSFVGNAGFYGAMCGVGYGHEIVLDDCEFMRNYAWGLGGGAADLDQSTITNCVFTENRAYASGGALRLSGISRTNRVTNCVFRGNRASWGGAILCEGHSDVRDCLFVGNEAAVGGGAGQCISNPYVTVSNCVLAGNRAGQQGGAWGAREWTSLEILNCTIAGNRSSRGRALVVDMMKPFNRIAVWNSILSNGGDEIWSSDSPVEVAYSCISGGAQAIDDPKAWLVWGLGNTDADPCFADAGYWDPNGTADDPNDDFFVEGDYHLKSQAGRWDPNSRSWVQDDVTSPCIDAGDPNDPIGEEPFPNGGRINMGAYGGTTEASKSYFGEPVSETIIAGDINGDGKVDWTDFEILSRHWLQETRR